MSYLGGIASRAAIYEDETAQLCCEIELLWRSACVLYPNDSQQLPSQIEKVLLASPQSSKSPTSPPASYIEHNSNFLDLWKKDILSSVKAICSAGYFEKITVADPLPDLKNSEERYSFRCAFEAYLFCFLLNFYPSIAS